MQDLSVWLLTLISELKIATFLSGMFWLDFVLWKQQHVGHLYLCQTFYPRHYYYILGRFRCSITMTSKVNFQRINKLHAAHHLFSCCLLSVFITCCSCVTVTFDLFMLAKSTRDWWKRTTWPFFRLLMLQLIHPRSGVL